MITKKNPGRVKKIGRTIHPKNGIIPLLSVYWKKFKETGFMDRRHGSGQPRTVFRKEEMDLIEVSVCWQENRSNTHLAPRKIAKQKGTSRSLIWRMVNKECLISLNTWKHHIWVKGLKTEEKLVLASIVNNLKVTSVWSKKRFDKIKKTSLLKFLSICRTIVYRIKERNLVSVMKVYLVWKARCPKKSLYLLQFRSTV